MAEPEALRVAFFKGQDSTHSSRDLPLGFGTRCWDIDLRSGIYEPRPGPARFDNETNTEWLHVMRYPSLLMAVDLPSGQTSLLIVEPLGDGGFNCPVFYKRLHFENEADSIIHPGVNPWYHRALDRVVVMNRQNYAHPHQCQVTEPCEAAAYGNKLYICNLGADHELWYSTAEIDLRDLKGQTLGWPKARHICMSPDGYPVFLDVYARGPLSVETSDQPLSATGEPTFGSNYDEIPGGAGDRNMRGIFHQNGLFIFQKRSVFVLWGPPPEWDHELVLNSIGTLSPSSVVSIDQYIYFLGNDGIVKRMTGEKGIVENVGAYTPDGRSPIENSLKGYYTKPSGEAGEHRYNGVMFNSCPVPPTYNVDVTNDRVTAAKGTATGEEFLEGTNAESIPFADSDQERFYQTFRADPTGNYANGFLLRGVTLKFYTAANDTVATIRLQIKQHTSDSASDDSLDTLAESIQTVTGDAGEYVTATFSFDDVPLEIGSDGVVPTWRIAIRKVDDTGGTFIACKPAGGYSRGEFVKWGGVAYGDVYFTTLYAYYRADTWRKVIGNTESETSATWKLASYVADVPEHTSVALKMVDAAGTEQEIENLGAVILDVSGNVSWRFYFYRDDDWPSRSPTLTDMTLHYLKGANAADEPFAVNWDGRYCLSLLRRDANKRDLFVWDNEAWSIWRADRPYLGGSGYNDGCGFHRLAVLPDTQNRQRLVFFDPEKSDGTSYWGFVNCLLKDFPFCQSPSGWRVPVPQFISREMLIAGGLAGKIKESYFRCTDLGMTGTIRKGLAFDGGDWMLLDQDIVIPPGTVNHDHLYTERPYPNEGRFCRAYVGFLDEFLRGSGLPPNALCKVQDWILIPFAFGFREGLHTGA